MSPDLVRRVLETYYQARVFFDALARGHSTATPLGVRRVWVERTGPVEDKDHVRHALHTNTVPTDSAHVALAMAHWRAGLDAQVHAHVSPFIETLAEALPVAHAPYGNLVLTHQQNMPDGEGVAPPHRMVLRVNGVTLENGNAPDPHNLTWSGLLHFLQRAHTLPTLDAPNEFTQLGRPMALAATREDAEILWQAAERKVGHAPQWGARSA
jgi:hypothetical protein